MGNSQDSRRSGRITDSQNSKRGVKKGRSSNRLDQINEANNENHSPVGQRDQGKHTLGGMKVQKIPANEDIDEFDDLEIT